MHSLAYLIDGKDGGLGACANGTHQCITTLYICIVALVAFMQVTNYRFSF